MLETGEKAPDFELKAQDGKTYSLDSFEERFLILFFYPRGDSPG
ncbi:AhpC/TSA family protein [Halarsenatibacter silvermanii]|uniref:AhpC/TSA family protein n=2 Tax=Halarsenatibacter silvermanii TaxID=321763 RepID=A0A1G9KIJ2_9FIRM|nr:AhpC/TSA family protein [Halarsenatibacter silvermanii]